VKAAALDLAACGFRVLPLDRKVPRTPNGCYDATTDPDVIGRWWTQWPGADVGIRTGGGLAVLDVDPRHGGDETLARLEDAHGWLRTMTARTGGGGWHLYFAGDLPARSAFLPGLDLKAEGGYVVAPPSTHASGRRYEWVAPADLPTEPQPAPAWLAELVDPPRSNRAPSRSVNTYVKFSEGARYVAAAIEAECMAVANAPEGERNETLNRAAFALGRFVAEGKADPLAVHDALTAAARHAGLTQREIRLTIRSGFRGRRAA
jgi:hypothetical protein